MADSVPSTSLVPEVDFLALKEAADAAAAAALEKKRKADETGALNLLNQSDAAQRRRLNEPDNSIKVSGTSQAKSVAGKIAHSLREGASPVVLAIGPNSINQAVKAVAIARGYVHQEGYDISCQPAFRESEYKVSVALYLYKCNIQPNLQINDNMSEMHISKTSVHIETAGSIACKIREHKEVSTISIGVDSVANAILAMCHTRVFLQLDKKDILVFPEFVIVKKDVRDLNAVKMRIVPINI